MNLTPSLAGHLSRVIRRARAFYRQTEPGHALIAVSVPAEAPAVPPLRDFNLDRQLGEWLDYRLAAARARWAVRDGIDDDALPVTCPVFGIAEHTAWLGAEVLLQDTTCLPVPMVSTPEDLSRLALRTDTRWFGYMQRGYAHLRARRRGDFLLCVRGAMAPMDMANAIRGDDLFTDFLEQPEFAHRLMAFLVDAGRWYYHHLLSWTDDLEGGHAFSYGTGWMPPRTIGHLSNDAAMLCGRAIYREFGLPYETRYVDGFDHVLYHVHSASLQYVPDLATLPHLSMLELTTDPKTPPPIETLPRMMAATGRANLMLHASSDQVRAHLAELAGRNVFLDVGCRDRTDAEDIVAFVRARTRPLE